MKNKFLKILGLLSILLTTNLYGMEEPDPERVGDNFHIVDKNLYRSGIIKDPEKYKKVIEQFDVKIVITFTKKIIKEERKIIGDKDGVFLRFMELKANNHPKISSVIELLKILKTYIERGQVVWMHDKDGANRTGLASALYVIFLEKDLTREDRMKKAEGGQFSWWKYGYLSKPQRWFNSTNVMDYSLKLGKCYFDLCDLIENENLELENVNVAQLQKKIGDPKFENILECAIAIYNEF